MCLFSRPSSPSSIAYKKGVLSFDCGACPECLSKKARRWALRAVYESQQGPACMVTLTYDQYIHDGRGRVIGERVAERNVDKRDVQLFIKRLRKWFVSKYGKDYRIKYLITAEYGKRTHRPHYHALLFNVKFPDAVPYKRSKRGNLIYTSDILDNLWHNGICTVDTQNLSAACARYCTKYCAKDSRAEDTFMLFSRGIGEEGLLRDFNGKSYWIDGREYPIPRQIWEKYIVKKYSGIGIDFSPKYYSPRGVWSRYLDSQVLRRHYFDLRDSDPLYQQYIKYWSDKVEQFDRVRPDSVTRILQLPDNKYFAYKVAALECLQDWHNFLPKPAPRSGCVGEWNRWKWDHRIDLPLAPCYKAANDTKRERAIQNYHRKLSKKYLNFHEIIDPLSPDLDDIPIEWCKEDFIF